jgi:hypothetical protein
MPASAQKTQRPFSLSALLSFRVIARELILSAGTIHGQPTESWPIIWWMVRLGQANCIKSSFTD